MGCIQSTAGCLLARQKLKMAAMSPSGSSLKTQQQQANPPPPSAPDPSQPQKEVPQVVKPPRSPQYMCDICGQEGLSELEMRAHVLLSHIESQISCPFCDLEGTTLEEMNLHVNAEHLELLTPTKDTDVKQEASRNPAESCKKFSEKLNQLQMSGGSHHGGLEHEDVSPMDVTISVPQKFHASYLPTEDVELDGNQSLKRSKLHLNVLSPAMPRSVTVPNQENTREDINSNKTCFISTDCDNDKKLSKNNSLTEDNATSTLTYSCPLCGWGTNQVDAITKHVNVAHLDAQSPPSAQRQGPQAQTHMGVKIQPSDHHNNNTPLSSGTIIHSPHSTAGFVPGAGTLDCPFCGIYADSPSSLEIHVHTMHQDILSPDTVNSSMSEDSIEMGGDSALVCPVCGMEFSHTNKLQTHVEGHFSAEQTPESESGIRQQEEDVVIAQELAKAEEEKVMAEERELKKLQEQFGMKDAGGYKKQAERALERAVVSGELSIADFYSARQQTQSVTTTGVEDGHSCTNGIIPALQAHYRGMPQNISRTWLCAQTDHYAASYGDKGWGCGYRNLQMMLSCLKHLPFFEQVLFNGRPLIPSVPKIQRLIEAAWQKGFDRAGSEQLGNHIVNTNKWIGATEIVATLSSLKVKCQLLDFHAPTGPGNTHPRLFDWVRDYFKCDQEFKAPLYLQHQGHSRTIFGIEELKDGNLRLLIFDPSCSKKQMEHFVSGSINANLMRTLRRPLSSLKANQYQIVAVLGILSDKEYEDSKMLKSDRIP